MVEKMVDALIEAKTGKRPTPLTREETLNLLLGGEPSLVSSRDIYPNAPEPTKASDENVAAANKALQELAKVPSGESDDDNPDPGVFKRRTK
ncbi:hypothetical protein GCM10027296_12310 [Chitinimonas naiadis]